MKFIILTQGGKKVRFNADHIVTYWSSGGNTEVETTKEIETVIETLEEIDNLLKESGA